MLMLPLEIIILDLISIEAQPFKKYNVNITEECCKNVFSRNQKVLLACIHKKHALGQITELYNNK